VIPVARTIFSLVSWMLMLQDSGKEWYWIALVGLEFCFMPGVFW